MYTTNYYITISMLIFPMLNNGILAGVCTQTNFLP